MKCPECKQRFHIIVESFIKVPCVGWGSCWKCGRVWRYEFHSAKRFVVLGSVGHAGYFAHWTHQTLPAHYSLCNRDGVFHSMLWETGLKR